MQYKLIVVDMDGTLLNSKKEVSHENKEALKRAMDKGVQVAIATGRIFTSARFYAKLIGISTPIIACNGALIRGVDGNEVIYSNAIQKEDAIAVAEVCKKYNLYFHFYDQERFFIEGLGFSSLKYYDWNEKQKKEDRIHMEMLEDALDFIRNQEMEILKFVIMDEDYERLDKVKKELQQMTTIEIDKSWHNNLEVMNKGVSKGKGIQKLQEILKIEKEEIIAFGDNYNDLSMKEYVGTFVAMANGEDPVKKHSHYITASNDESGVAKGIEKLVL